MQDARRDGQARLQKVADEREQPFGFGVGCVAVD
jgi:hypothetical protein